MHASCCLSMPFFRLIFIVLAVPFFFAERAFAKAVISEVHWAGSDLSTSDEWVEIAGSGSHSAGSGPSAGSETDGESLAGWTLTSINGSGVETVIFTFPENATIRPGEFLAISRFGAAQSRLLSEPVFVTGAMSLPNTKLLLRLRDPGGQIMDQADDGVGSPFAGTNSTSPVLKASMERINLFAQGDDPANWITASRSHGFDEGAPILGTPGFPRSDAASTIASSSLSSQASSFSSQTGTVSSSSLSCANLDPYFILQSGATSGVGKVTLNIQIGARQGSLTGASCAVDFDDGTLSNSCNPPSHAYDEPGTYTISAEVRQPCGAIVMRTMQVQVTGSSSSSRESSSLRAGMGELEPTSDAFVSTAGQGFVITGVLPNPSGKDSGNEWVEIRNVSGQTASLDGWTLRLPHAKKSTFTFGSVGFFLHETKRFSDRDLGMTFGNAYGELSLIAPSGDTVSALVWKDARDGVTIRPDRPSAIIGPLQAKVLHVVDGDTLDVQVMAGGRQTERVRLIGIDAPELHSSDSRQIMLGRRSAEFLRTLIEGETLTLDVGPTERDGYGRLLAYATTAQGDGLQEILLREGMVSVYLRFQFAKESEFIAYQREAQEANAGMWGILQGSMTDRQAGELPILIATVFPMRSSSSSRAQSSSKKSSSWSFPSIARPTGSSGRALRTGKKSSAKKKTAPKTAVAKSPVIYRNIVEDSSSPDKTGLRGARATEEVPGDGPNFSPLHDDFRELETLIDDQVSTQSDALLFERSDAENRGSGLPLIAMGIAISGTASGIAGWWLARRRR